MLHRIFGNPRTFTITTIFFFTSLIAHTMNPCIASHIQSLHSFPNLIISASRLQAVLSTCCITIMQAVVYIVLLVLFLLYHLAKFWLN